MNQLLSVSCIYDMSSNGLILRHSVYRLLVSSVEFSAQILKFEMKSDHEMSETIADGYRTEACIQRKISNHSDNAMESDDGQNSGPFLQKGFIVRSS